MTWFNYYLLIGIPFGIYGALKFIKQAKAMNSFNLENLPLIKKIAYFILVFGGCYLLYPLVIGDIIIDAVKIYKIKRGGTKR